ncbi:hypothetical protein DSL92_06315 [Billgrantia gudaonensis]|uniref:Uncharacterized protein n=1 Tax=Billgrantia gudaonensis TaxID=376427 RepID=A0A432JJE7_9GAMM|nr:hypothetical protein DSL92_06315 [Halomonas gudaonensis]
MLCSRIIGGGVHFFNTNNNVVAGWGLALGSWLVFFYGAVLAIYWIFRNKEAKSSYEIGSKIQFMQSSRAFLLQALPSFAAGGQRRHCRLLLSNYELGLFKTPERAAIVISFVLIVINAVLRQKLQSFM